MVKRILDCKRSDFEKMSSQDLFESIKFADGRTIMQQVYGIGPPLVDEVSNVEIAAAFGADLIELVGYDPNDPKVVGLSKELTGSKGDSITINDVKKFVGRPIGAMITGITKLEEPIEKIAKNLVKQGSDFISIIEGSNNYISKAVKKVKNVVKDETLVIAGNAHVIWWEDWGRKEQYKKVLTPHAVRKFIEAGADIVRIPGAGTTPGFGVDYATELIDIVHESGKLALTNVCTSQEGSDLDTIRNIALYNKMAGSDIHHISYTGYLASVAIPQIIMGYSIAIRGRHHTYSRMAWSLKR